MKIARNSKGELVDILDSNKKDEYYCMICKGKVFRHFGKKFQYYSHQKGEDNDCELKISKILENIHKSKEIIPLEENNIELVDYDKENELLKGLNEQQIQAVIHKDHPCMVIASAGSGKTLILTHRIAYLIQQGISPDNILAITFTKKASEEMTKRINKLMENNFDSNIDDLSIGTFHSICYQMIREQNYVTGVKLIKNWQQTKFIEQILDNNKNIDWDYKSCLNFISLQKNNMISSDDPKNELLLYDDSIEFLRDDLYILYSEYEKLKDNENLIDFNDMLLKCYNMLLEDEGIRKYYQNKFKYILVDEFQDTNHIQFEILKLLLNENENLFVVGDDKQSIYAFNFSDVGIMLDFQKTINNVKVIKLNVNYRSSKEIVDISNRLIAHNENQLNNISKSNMGTYKPVKINKYFDEYEEGEAICDKIKELHSEGYDYKDIAILYRCNSQSQAIEDKLIASKIPYIIIGGQNFFHRKEIMDITAYLRVILNHNNNEAIKRIINIPNRYLGNAFINQISNYASSHNDSIYNCLLEDRIVGSKKYWRNGAEGLYNIIDKLSELDIPVKGLINVIIEKIEYVEYLRKLNDDSDIQDKVDNINVFKSVSEKFDNLKEFLEYIDKMIKESSKNISKQDKVKLLTIHRSKGLEFPVVFLIDVNIGLLPHKRSNNIEEERRICYVGLSRGQKELHISYTDTYNGTVTGASIFISNMKKISKEPK
jgi:DNA helicase-2/ATP-dependent DNA helicase PcrA